MMSLLYHVLFWKAHTEEGKPGATFTQIGKNNSEIKKSTEEKESGNDAPKKSPQFVDITKDQAFWEKAVPS